jgi:uncharacterized protein YjlB
MLGPAAERSFAIEVKRTTPPRHPRRPRQAPFRVGRSDVLVLPPARPHCSTGSSADLLVVGVYPPGQHWDLRRGDPAEHDEVLANVARVGLPQDDPVLGPDGPLIELWGA